MKWGLLLFFLAAGFNADAQSLKDLLYGGKLKKGTTGVIRKTDDLSTKIDTGQKSDTLIIDSLRFNQDSVTSDSTVIAAPDLMPVADFEKDSTNEIIAIDSAEANVDREIEIPEIETPATPQSPKAPVIAKSNNRIWKDYTDSLKTVLETEVLNNKKIKKGTYYLTLEYEIDLDGTVEVTKIISSPENAVLQSQVQERLMYGAPQMNPLPASATKKVKRKYNFNITKN